MPWITVTTGPHRDPEMPSRLAEAVAAAVASPADLAPSDVVVLVQVATAASGPGAMVAMSGRVRGDSVEESIRVAVREAVAGQLGLDPDLVSHVRL
ncbi:hypothetical protein [Segeticoccus rhizosphaerae]|jgi:phenylpyruvate tautomerase PptA (4-oxalocrotonate tautomerase family)|uniref:hypothetical protein n=1 Tax=Segeticoccus rhizosphaerae TaxID=1104777 RepID=UPI0010BFF0FB|nr:hypothetical protein [Ornithinicoccus soli]